ncbi:MAG TPA: hypothetical protein VHO24_01910 [Opitutaceae bacterium]|nr:hypothetical protein [Opitutaceae bacterium]
MNLLYFSFLRTARWGRCLALAALAVPGAFGASPVSSVPIETAAPKTHVLFVGADFSVEQNRRFYPVEDVTPGAVVIKPGNKAVNVPLSQSTGLLITETLKISGASVAIDRLKVERAYANGSDPFDQLARASALAAENTALADIARGEVMRANMAVAAASGSSGSDRAAAAAQSAQAEANFSKAIDAPVSQVYDVGGQAVKATGEEMFDAIRITFAVAAETDLPHAYIGVVARIRERDSKPGQVRKWAYVEALGSMAAGVSRKVLVYRDGFPPGYILEGCELHFYRGRDELATNLSRRRVELSDDEALEYRIIEYIDANKGRTLPAVLVTTSLADTVRRPLSSVQLRENYHVRVGKNGRVVGVFRDAAGKQALQDAALESAVKTLRFKPALDAGKPVESIATLNFGQLN